MPDLNSSSSVNFLEDFRQAVEEWHTCTTQEIEEAVMYTGNTAPEIDKTLSLIIKKAWPILKGEIILLFQLCPEKRHYLTVFKTTILCVLPKPENWPKHLLRSYCLIALLSYLEKVLEKIVAQRLEDIALKFRLISLAHFDVISGHSTVDAACILTYDIERAWEKKEVLTTLAFDIKKTFNTITEKRLIKQL